MTPEVASLLFYLAAKCKMGEFKSVDGHCDHGAAKEEARRLGLVVSPSRGNNELDSFYLQLTDPAKFAVEEALELMSALILQREDGGK